MLIAYIFLVPLFYAITQDALFLEAYNVLRPGIDVFQGTIITDSNFARSLLFYEPLSARGPVLLSNVQSLALNILPFEQIGKERSDMISTFFWDPHTRKNSI